MVVLAPGLPSPPQSSCSKANVPSIPPSFFHSWEVSEERRERPVNVLVKEMTVASEEVRAWPLRTEDIGDVGEVGGAGKGRVTLVTTEGRELLVVGVVALDVDSYVAIVGIGMEGARARTG